MNCRDPRLLSTAIIASFLNIRTAAHCSDLSLCLVATVINHIGYLAVRGNRQCAPILSHSIQNVYTRILRVSETYENSSGNSDAFIEIIDYPRLY